MQKNKDYLKVRLGNIDIEIDFTLKTIDIFGANNEALIQLSKNKILSISTNKIIGADECFDVRTGNTIEGEKTLITSVLISSKSTKKGK